MKIIGNSAKQQASPRRRGTLFHYYMMYLFLSSVLMTSAGLCLHSILKADRIDTQVAEYLVALERLEMAFREDASSLPATANIGGITFSADNEQSARWTIKENLVTRESLRGEEVESTERFLFPTDTSIQMVQEKRFVICRLTEPSAMPAGYEDAPSQAKVVEIVAGQRRLRLTKTDTAASKTEPPVEEIDATKDANNIDSDDENSDARPTTDNKKPDSDAKTGGDQ